MTFNCSLDLTPELYDPSSPLPEQHLLRVFDGPIYAGEKFYFIRQHEHLLIYREDFHTYPESAGELAGTTELFEYQFAIPMSGIRWFIEVIEQKFFKSPNEGGLPANKLSYEEIVAGEDLHVMRSMGGGHRPGYTITNATQRAHGAERNPQRLTLPDDWLFEGGLMDYLKELADKYENGQL